VPPLDSIALSIPFAAISRQHDWATLIASANGIEKRMLQVKELAFRIVRDFDTSCSPEKLAWLAIWVRLFGCIEAADRLRSCPNDLALRCLARVAYEAQIQAMVIRQPIDPLRTGQSLPATDHPAWQQVADRLRGFLAWAISYDLFRTECALHPATLQDLLVATTNDPAPTPDEEALLSYFWPDLEVISEAEAIADTDSAVTTLQARKARLTTWLRDARLADWAVKIDPQRSTKCRKPPDVYELLVGKSNVHQALQALGWKSLYGAYRDGSALIHGSTLDLLLTATDGAALTEALNAKIQEIKYRARGYRNRENFRLAILFHCGGLDMNPR
jgi:hypothetical protein